MVLNMKLTETEGTILAELILKLSSGDEKLADKVVDAIADMVCGTSAEIQMRDQESIYQYIAGWGV